MGRARWSQLAFAAPFFALVTPHQAAAETRELAPSSNWVVDYGDDSCALFREFGGAENPVFFEIRQFEPGNTLQFTIATNSSRRRDGHATVTITPEDEAQRIERPLLLTTENYGDGFRFSRSLRPRRAQVDGDGTRGRWTAAERSAREAEITGIEVASIFYEDFRLRTGSLQQPMEVLRDCTRNLVEVWGYDSQQYAQLSRRARTVDFDSWRDQVTGSYPPGMARAGEQAQVRARLRIDASGRPTECRALDSINDPVFDQTTCDRLMEDGRFAPALDADGEAVDSFLITTVMYRMNP